MPARRVPGAGLEVAPSEAVATLHIPADCGAGAAVEVAMLRIATRQRIGFIARRFGGDAAAVKMTLAGVSGGHYVRVTLALGRLVPHPHAFAALFFVRRHDPVALRSS